LGPGDLWTLPPENGDTTRIDEPAVAGDAQEPSAL